MGVLPLEFREGENAKSLGLSGEESFTIEGIKAGLKPRQHIEVKACGANGKDLNFTAIVRLESPVEIEYFVNGGILPTVLRQMLTRK